VSSLTTAAPDVAGRLRGSAFQLLGRFTPSWIILCYAVLLLVSGWSYSVLRIRADREQTLSAERARVSAVAAALETGIVAMFNDGVGAAAAGANEITASGALSVASDDELIRTLQKMLTGGQYVRSLFLVGRHRFARAGHAGMQQAAELSPDWLAPLERFTASSTWIGRPMPDPDQPDRTVVPVARRLTSNSGEMIWAGGLFDFATMDALGGRTNRTVGYAGLVSRDGTVLFTLAFPGGRQIAAGMDISSSPLFLSAARQSAGGVLQGFAPNLGASVLAAYQPVQDYPMIVVTAESLDSALSPWRERRLTMLLVTTVASVLLALITRLSMRYMRARRVAQELALASSERERLQTASLFKMASRADAGLKDIEPLLKATCADASEALQVDQVCVYLFEDDVRSLRLAGQYGLILEDTCENMAIAAHRIPVLLERLRGERAIAIDGVNSDPVLAELSAENVPIPKVAAIVAAAIRTSTEIAGLILVAQRRPRPWHTDEVTFVTDIADHVARMLLYSQREQTLGELRQLAGELMRSQDKERRRIGRDLHDSTGQALAALELELERLARCSEMLAPEQIAQLQTCAQLAHQCTSEIRTASYLLHPPLLDELGLISALRWLADGVQQRSKIEVRLDLPDSLARLSPDRELVLFRVAQEALTNVLRHTDSPWVEIRLRRLDQSIQLEIEDAGSRRAQRDRWRTRRPSSSVGVGLAGMRERIQQIGGTFAVHQLAAGTCIRATVSGAFGNPASEVPAA
jgi:signal transduction histidine kinase